MLSASKHRWRTICLCVSGAIVFWLLNALNKVYTTEIDYPVSLIIDESKVAFEQVPPSTMCIEVTGVGWRLLRYLLRLDVQPVEIPVDKISQKGKIKSEYFHLFFAKRLKDLKVRRVLLEETLYVHAISSPLPLKE